MGNLKIGDVVLIHIPKKYDSRFNEIKIAADQYTLNNTFGRVREFWQGAVRVGRWWWPPECLHLAISWDESDLLRETVDLLQRENEILRCQLGYSRDEKVKGSYGV